MIIQQIFISFNFSQSFCHFAIATFTFNPLSHEVSDLKHAKGKYFISNCGFAPQMSQNHEQFENKINDRVFQA